MCDNFSTCSKLIKISTLEKGYDIREWAENQIGNLREPKLVPFVSEFQIKLKTCIDMGIC